MAKNDIEIIVYKILSYLYGCMKNGVAPEAEDICCECRMFKVPESYWLIVMEELIGKGYVRGLAVSRTKTGSGLIVLEGAGITLDGAEYLVENSRMKEAAAFAGKAFDIVLGSVIGALIESQC